MKTVTTPKGKAVWPRVNEPDTKFHQDGVYSVKLHVSEEDFKAFEASLKPKLDAAYKSECDRLGKSKLKMASSSPLRITEEGDYEIYAKQKAQITKKDGEIIEFSIKAFDSRGFKVVMPNVGSGSILKLSVEPNTWYVPSQGFGYSLRLKAVQILDLVEFEAAGDQGNFGFSVEADGFIGSGETLDDAFDLGGWVESEKKLSQTEDETEEEEQYAGIHF